MMYVVFGSNKNGVSRYWEFPDLPTAEKFCKLRNRKYGKRRFRVYSKNHKNYGTKII